jgi:hypothetical protein
MFFLCSDPRWIAIKKDELQVLERQGCAANAGPMLAGLGKSGATQRALGFSGSARSRYRS